jgi:hypothetical protein
MESRYYLHLLVAVIIFPNCLFTQDYYLLDDIGNVREIENCVDVRQFDHSVSGVDISMDGFGQLYIVTTSGALYLQDLEDGGIETLSEGTSGMVINSLTHDVNNDLFAMGSGGDIYQYDFSTNGFELLFTLDIGASGDIVFYKGKLLASAHGNYLIEIDLETGDYKIIMCLPEYIFALTNDFVDCDNQTILAFGVNSRKVYALDLYTETIDTLCQTQPIGSGWNVYGATSRHEYLGSNCVYYPEIITSDCVVISSNATPLNQQQNTIDIYPNPASNTLSIKGVEKVELINIYDFSGRL